MSDTDKKYVPEGVYLVCDKGQMASQLLANPERNVTIYGAKKCTEADNKFEQNILPFGSCKTCGTCKFAKVEWTKTKQGVKAKGSYALLEHSEGICKEGQGVIKIYFDEYLADLANENNNESAFVKESISSEILGDSLTFPFGRLIDLFCDDDNKFTEGVGRGFKKGMEGTWNFLTSDMWKADTWKGMGKLAVIGVAYSSPVTGGLMGDISLQALDNTFGTDFKQTKDNLVEGVKKTAGNAWEDVKRGNMGEVGESYGQLQYAVVEALAGTKGAGLALKGATTGAKALIGAERLAQVAVTASNWMSKLKAGALGLVKVGRKPMILFRDGLEGVEKATAELIEKISQRRKVIFAKKGTDDAKYLEWMNAEANVGGENMKHILLNENPSKAAVLEEFLHGTQYDVGIIKSSEDIAKAEYHVKDFMIRHKRILGLGEEDVKILEKLRDRDYQVLQNQLKGK